MKPVLASDIKRGIEKGKVEYFGQVFNLSFFFLFPSSPELPGYSSKCLGGRGGVPGFWFLFSFGGCMGTKRNSLRLPVSVCFATKTIASE